MLPVVVFVPLLVVDVLVFALLLLLLLLLMVVVEFEFDWWLVEVERDDVEGVNDDEDDEIN